MNVTQESIFISGLRAFCKTLGVAIGIGVFIIIFSFGMSALSDSIELPEKADLTVSADAEGNQKLLADTVPVILRIDMHGLVGGGDFTAENLENILLSSRTRPLSKSRVKGILLHMRTPGGIAYEGFNMYNLIKDYREKYKMPVYVFVDGLSASAGMMISAAADQVNATPSSMVGSVGVRIGPAFNVVDMMEKIGVRAKIFTAGKDKAALSPFKAWEEGEGAPYEEIIEDEYVRFVNIVTSARKRLDKEKLINEYGAKVFSAPMGEKLGFIDNGNSSYIETLKELVTAAGIKEGETYQVILAKPHRSILKELAKSSSALMRGKIEHVLPLGTNMTSEMSGKLLYLYQP